LGEILIYSPVLIASVAFGCWVLVRKLPKRNPRVFGPRHARMPFVWLGYLAIVGPGVLFAVFIFFSGTLMEITLIHSILLFGSFLFLILLFLPAGTGEAVTRPVAVTRRTTRI
jgi:hypothetical protein